MLDLYQGRWQGKLLPPGEFVICADEKPSIQARRRIHETLPLAPGSRGQRVEHTYERRVLTSFDRLVWQVRTKPPYASARRVFWIVDNGSSHRGQKAVERHA